MQDMQASPLRDAKKILDRLRTAAGVEKDADLARVLGISEGTIGSWKSRGTVPERALIASCKKLGLSVDAVLSPDEASVSILNIHGSSVAEEGRLVQIPMLVDIEASAHDEDGGFIVDVDEGDYEPSGVALPDWFIRAQYGVSPERVFYMRARGSSMVSTIFPGQRILCARLPPGTTVRDDLIYICRSPSGILVKRLYVEPDHIHVWSDNPEAPRYRIPLARWEDEYRALAIALEVTQPL